ncbi:hypothetical protein TNCV_803171 [Trichonephila clavipes]|nr:hypothetical protein TNCV_803171 [Trichonephila clavipes]
MFCANTHAHTRRGGATIRKRVLYKPEQISKPKMAILNQTRYSAVASPIRSAQTLRLPATTANATGLPAQPTPGTHTKRASDFCSPFQGYLV